MLICGVVCHHGKALLVTAISASLQTLRACEEAIMGPFECWYFVKLQSFCQDVLWFLRWCSSVWGNLEKEETVQWQGRKSFFRLPKASTWWVFTYESFHISPVWCTVCLSFFCACDKAVKVKAVKVVYQINQTNHLTTPCYTKVNYIKKGHLHEIKCHIRFGHKFKSWITSKSCFLSCTVMVTIL